MQLGLWQILALAVVQGVTEFLPISSSGHLVVLASLISSGDVEHLEVSDLNIVLHIGTLFSILIFYWSRILRLLNEDRRTVGLLIVGTIPAVVIGLTIKVAFEDILESPLLAGCLLPVTGLILLWAVRELKGERRYQDLSYRHALVIGCSQAAAILPGLSRSGTTISAGLKLGLAPRSAATFSFLLAIPAIGGAGVLEVASLLSHGESMTTPWTHLLSGGLVAFLVGLGSLFWLINWLERGKLQLFAWWCIPLGIGVVLWQLLGV
jgi:undecaprenyl-diphosphatase